MSIVSSKKKKRCWLKFFQKSSVFVIKKWFSITSCARAFLKYEHFSLFFALLLYSIWNGYHFVLESFAKCSYFILLDFLFAAKFITKFIVNSVFAGTLFSDYINFSAIFHRFEFFLLELILIDKTLQRETTVTAIGFRFRLKFEIYSFNFFESPLRIKEWRFRIFPLINFPADNWQISR